MEKELIFFCGFQNLNYFLCQDIQNLAGSSDQEIMQNTLPMRLCEIQFDLTLLPSWSADEEKYHAAHWKTSNFLRLFCANSLTPRDLEIFCLRLDDSVLNTMGATLSMDTDDLNDTLESAPIRMKRHQRMSFIQDLKDVKDGKIQQPPPPPESEMSEFELSTLADRKKLTVNLHFFVSEIKGTHQSEWPLLREQRESHLLIWYVLIHPEKFAHKTILELGVEPLNGTTGFAGLTIGRMRLARQVIITTGRDVGSDKNLFENLKRNCAFASEEKGDCVKIQQINFDGDDDDDVQRLLKSTRGECDIILGCDILNYTLSIPRLPLIAAKKLLKQGSSSRSEACFYVAHSMKFGRSHLDSIRTYAEEELGLSMEIIPPCSFLPQPAPFPLNEFGKRDVVLLLFQLMYP